MWSNVDLHDTDTKVYRNLVALHQLCIHSHARLLSIWSSFLPCVTDKTPLTNSYVAYQIILSIGNLCEGLQLCHFVPLANCRSLSRNRFDAKKYKILMTGIINVSKCLKELTVLNQCTWKEKSFHREGNSRSKYLIWQIFSVFWLFSDMSQPTDGI